MHYRESCVGTLGGDGRQQHGDECNRGEELHGETPESGQGRMKRRGVQCGSHSGGAAPLTPKVYG